MTMRTSNSDKLQTTGLNAASPPSPSTGILTDIRLFCLQKPAIPTLVRFRTEYERKNYSRRILQRVGINVNEYTVLNIHRIGIDAPVSHVFEELLNWNGDSTCWPNHLARVERLDDRLENIRILLFGQRDYPFGFDRSLLGFRYIPLFKLNALRIQRLPDPVDFDNARYLLYESTGGYPIGVFSLYVRSPIDAQGERAPAQLFLLVGFNFYGKENWSRRNAIHQVWEGVHDRVTANVLNRFKQLCEWRFRKTQAGRA